MIGVKIMSKEIEKNYTFENVKKLNCDVVFSDIMISSDDNDSIRVHYKSDINSPELVPFHIDLNENELVITEKPISNDAKGKGVIHILLPSSSKDLDLDLLFANGNIIIDDIDASHIKAHSALGNISILSTSIDTAKVSTADGNITCKDTKIIVSGNIVTSDGDISLQAPFLPKKQLKCSSTTGTVDINIPDLGANYKFDFLKNEDQGGKFIAPFEFDSCITKKFDENDTFETNKCTVSKGNGEPYVKLVTGNGKIKFSYGK